MPDIDFAVRGNFFLLGRQFVAKAESTPRVIEEMTSAIAKSVANETKRIAPVNQWPRPIDKGGHPPGQLRRAIYSTPAFRTGNSFEAEVGINLGIAPYAVYVEEGTGIYGRKTPEAKKDAFDRFYSGGLPPKRRHRYSSRFPTLYERFRNPNQKTAFGSKKGRTTQKDDVAGRIGTGNLVFFSTYGGVGHWNKRSFVLGQPGQQFMRKGYENSRPIIDARIAEAGRRLGNL